MPLDLEVQTPRCPAWCEEDHDGWQRHPAAVTYTCHRLIRVEGRDIDAMIVLERFATLDGPGVLIEAPTIRLECSVDSFATADATLLADTLRRAAEMVGEPRVVAA